ncbi:hypothetical protein [Bacillus kexueae]|uniref:hypothetical protein n=1 Tax=Aeribacillus kexueae TaxID=2078952 RepID=UPI001FAF4D8C|nr:hypothetical protein [Bacillus kexueae]
MKKNIILFLAFSSGALLIAFIVYAALSDSENPIQSSALLGTAENKKVVNAPARKDIVKLATSDYEDGHEFISETHEFYNQTLGWGRLESANYHTQKTKAEEILAALDGIQIDNNDLNEDFGKIEKYATEVINSDDRQAMRMLHRLFHDLDIYFNGYHYNQTFGVTSYKGE